MARQKVSGSGILPQVVPGSVDGLLSSWGLLVSQLGYAFDEYARVLNYQVPEALSRNMLIDGSFASWGPTSLAAASASRYCADIWLTDAVGSTIAPSKLLFTPDGAVTIPPVATAHRAVVVGSAGSGHYARLEQRIRGAWEGLFTCSAIVRADATRTIWFDVLQNFGTGGSPSSPATTGKQSMTIGTDWQLISVTDSAPSVLGKSFGTNNDAYTAVRLWFDNEIGQSGTYDVTAAVLTPGDEPVDFFPDDPGLNDARIARFVERGSTATTFAPYDAGVVWDSHPSAVGVIPVRFRAPKWATPTLTVYDSAGTAGKISYYTSSWHAGGSATSITTDRQGFTLVDTTAGSIITGFTWLADARL